MKNPHPHISVYLLVEDSAVARDISAVFRKIGILPQYFSNLKSFWKAALDEEPTLAIIDVKKMSDGPWILKEHPKIKAESFPLAFFYNEATLPLLRSTADIFNVGLMEQNKSYEHSLKIILNRVNKLCLLQEKKTVLQEQITQLDHENKRLRENLEQRKKRENEEQMALKLLSTTLKSSLEGGFERYCDSLFSQWEEVHQFSYLVLSSNEQNLLSPELVNKKYKKLTSVILPRTCPEGLEFFARNLGMEMAMKALGGDCVPLFIQGEYRHPQVMLFLKVEKNFAENFNWKVLEGLLSGILGQFCLRKLAVRKGENFHILTPWEMLSSLDEHFYLASDFKKQLIDINFTLFMRVISEISYIRFKWKDFFKNFLGQLATMSTLPYSVAHFGIHHMAFLVDPRDGDTFLLFLKKHVLDFKYDRYVEGEDSIPWDEILPQIKKLPLSAISYLKTMENFPDSQLKKNISKTLRPSPREA